MNIFNIIIFKRTSNINIIKNNPSSKQEDIVAQINKAIGTVSLYGRNTKKKKLSKDKKVKKWQIDYHKIVGRLRYSTRLRKITISEIYSG